jgi:exodeoxyribonuclease-3
MPIVLDWLNEKRPDVLCLQETKVQDVDFPAEAIDEAAYNYVFKGQKSYNGVAILTKNRIADVQFGFENEPKDEARLIKAEINGVIIVNTYVPQGYLPESDKFQYKLESLPNRLTFTTRRVYWATFVSTLTFTRH